LGPGLKGKITKAYDPSTTVRRRSPRASTTSIVKGTRSVAEPVLTRGELTANEVLRQMSFAEEVYKKYSPLHLPPDCFNKNLSINIDKYKEYILSDVKLLDGEKLLVRASSEGPESFYDCMRIIIYADDRKHGATAHAKPSQYPELNVYFKEIAELRRQIHKHMLDDDSLDTFDDINELVGEWKLNPIPIQDQCDDATDAEKAALLKIDSIRSYIVATDYPWYCAGEIELKLAPLVYKFNILVWDISNMIFENYLCSANTKYCILMRTEDNHYDVLHLKPSPRGFISTWPLEDLGLTIRCMFNLNKDKFANMEYYQKDQKK
jgi:hypothetical protein